MPLLIYYDQLYMLHPLISALILPAVIHLVCLSEGKELPRFQRFRSTKTSNKFFECLGKDNKCRDIIR